MSHIPKSLNDVSPEWVASHFDGAPLRRIEFEVIGEGAGMMSVMAILHLDWVEPTGLPASLVVKLATDNEQNLEVARRFKPFLKEVNYYRELASMTPARSPAIYGAEIDDNHNFYLLMEDASSYRMGDQVIGATREECELCVDFLVAFHAAFWNNIESHDWIPHISNSENAGNMRLGCDAGWPAMLEHFGHLVPDEIAGLHRLYVEKIPFLQAQLDGAPITLVHCDLRQDNLMFGQHPGQEQLLVIDFQGPHKGRGVYDLSFLMSQSAQTSVRREHEQALVQQYAAGLKGKGIEYTFDTAWSEYRLGVLYAWTLAVVISGTLDPTNERGRAWMSKMIERNVAAIQDLECLDLLY